MQAKIVIPEELQGFLVAESSDDFNNDRMYITDNMLEIFTAIVDNRSMTEEMHELGMSYMNSTLLYGPPGTGKTTFARWVANQLHLDFVYINFAKLIGGIFGDTARNLGEIFKFMQDKEAIFMLDEIDCIAVKRGTESAATGGELSRITITLMQELDYYRSHQANTIVIAATNRIDQVDPALRSRFSVERELKRLTNSEKSEYICQFLDNVGDDGIPYDLDNIKQYCADTAIIPTRNIESDIQRCAVEWIKNNKKKYILNHLES